MWPWTKRDAMREPSTSFQFFPRAPRVRELQFGYEKVGATVRGETVPWNADAVFIEAVIETARGTPICREDFDLDIPGEIPSVAVQLRHEAESGLVHARFRFPPPTRARLANLHWKSRLLGQVALPYIGPQDFLNNLRLEAPTVFAHLGARRVACRSLVEGQGDGLTAAGLLRAGSSLLPVADWSLQVELVELATGRAACTPVALTGAAATGRQTVLNVPLPAAPRTPGAWSVRWTVAGRLLAHQDLLVVPRAMFRESLYVPGTPPPDGEDAGRAPAAGAFSGAGPCFQVASRLPGVAGLCPLEVRPRVGDGTAGPSSFLGEVLVTEAPAPWVPAPVAVEQLARGAALDLYSEGRFLGSVSWESPPGATLTSEGGFLDPQSYPWTALNEVELANRLARLARPVSDLLPS